MKQLIKRSIAAPLAVVLLLLLTLSPAQAREEMTRSDRVLHHRAMETAIWAMPLMNFKFYRDALIDAGIGPNDIGYYSKMQDWKFQTATPNNGSRAAAGSP
jgi:hypothetical protein